MSAKPKALARQSTGGDAESQKLQKVLAQAGLGSRRTMEVWIEAARVTVNGKTAKIGTRVTSADKIQVDGRDVRVESAAQPARVLIYHKPEGEIVTREDPQGRETVFTKLPRLRGARWLSIGRLDISTSGLLIFTTSGELANTMMHPRFSVEREYAARIFGTLSAEQTAQLRQGIALDDGEAHFESLEDEGGEGSNHWYRIVVTEGRNRLVRRLFEAVGFTVSRLIRVRFGILALPPWLKRGQVSELEPDEVRRLTAWLARPPKEARSPTAPKAPGRTSSLRGKTNTQSSPPLVSGQKNGKRGQVRSTRSRA
ncbi:MAG: 23S rRNA pseudouridine(2605) synthase RluB [Burkholderiales bacterium]